MHPKIAVCIWSLGDCTLRLGLNPVTGMYSSVARRTRAPSHHSGSIPYPSTEPPGTVRPANWRNPKTRPRPALLWLWQLHTTNCLILVFVLVRRLALEAVQKQLRIRYGLCKTEELLPCSEKAKPFQQVTRTLSPFAQSKSWQKKLIQHIKNKGHQNCQEKY